MLHSLSMGRMMMSIISFNRQRVKLTHQKLVLNSEADLKEE